MTLVMDGVRRSTVTPVGAAALAMPVAAEPVRRARRLATAKPISKATSKATQGVRYVTGMDGVRRPVPMAAPVAPREVLGNNLQPAAAMRATRLATEQIQPGVAAMTAAPTSSWALPALRLPSWRRWQRPAAAFGLVAMALVASGITAHALATPRSVTAHAESAAAAPSPAKATLAPAVTAATPAPTPAKAGLQRLLDGFVAANGADKFGIVVKDLRTSETASIAPSRQIESASLYKLFVAQRIYQRIDLGQLTYGQPAGGGTGRTIDQCLTIMINISDNACGRALGTILGWGAQNPALQLEGYKETNLAAPQQTSAEDVAHLFERLYNGTLVSGDSSNRFLALLKDQHVNDRLPVGLPAGTAIAHKTGNLDGVVHDAGIVYGPKTNYLVVVTSGSWSAPGTAPAKFVDLSRQLWGYFEQ